MVLPVRALVISTKPNWENTGLTFRFLHGLLVNSSAKHLYFAFMVFTVHVNKNRSHNGRLNPADAIGGDFWRRLHIDRKRGILRGALGLKTTAVDIDHDQTFSGLDHHIRAGF